MKKRLNELLKTPIFLYEKYHAKSLIKRKKKDLDPSKWPVMWTRIFYKGYLRFPELSLPNPRLKSSISLLKTLQERHSHRNFSAMKLSLLEISTLLYFSSGMKDLYDSENTKRFYPSAGNRYPLEVYILSLNSELPPGLYHYYLKTNRLEILKSLPNFNFDDYFLAEWAGKAGCIIFITSIFERTTVKYGERGYKFCLLEAGHLGQNIYLLATGLNLKCCGLGGVLETKVDELLDIDGIKESLIYTIALGK